MGRTLAVVAATAVWVAWWVPLHPQWAANRVLMSVYYLGFLAFSALLVARSPWFAFFCWIGYLHAYRFLTGPARYVGLVCTAALSAIAQLGGFHRPTPADWGIFAVVALLNATLVAAFIYLGAKAEEQNQERKRIIVELAEANRQLETMMTENTGLHAQLLTQAREAGVLEERQRMAREIHDTLAQGLAGIITQLEAAQQAGLQAAAGASNGREASRADAARPGARAGPGTAERPRAGRARPDRPRHLQPRYGGPPVHQRGHGQDPSAAHLREARRQRPRGRRGGRLRTRPAAKSHRLSRPSLVTGRGSMCRKLCR